MSDPPLEAFGLSGETVPLEGGRGTSLLVGDVILKPAVRTEEDEWRAAVYERTPQDGFRLPRPVRSVDGRVVVEGWIALERLDGVHSTTRQLDVLDLSQRFHAAIAAEPRPAFLDRAADPWTTTQRAVWGQAPLDPYLAMKHVARLVQALRPVGGLAQLVHSDLTTNVLFADPDPPAIIDLSPWWAPPEYARAIVVADSLLWDEADEALAELVDPQFLLRAVLFRKIVDRLLRPDERERADDDDHYAPVVDYALELAK